MALVVRLMSGLLLFSGLLILSINLAGLFLPLRAPVIDGYVDFAGGQTIPFQSAVEELDALEKLGTEDPVSFVTKATHIFHDGIAHILPRDVRENGTDYYRMRIPVTENWVLFTLSFLRPGTYRDYEFCSYRKALERGIGRCGQQSLALVSYLSRNGIETGFVALGGHAIVTAKVDDEHWYLLDPDYGGVIPFDISEAEQNPSAVLPYYWSRAALENRIDRVYAPENQVKYGGPNARFARACPIESISYFLKWFLPLLFASAAIVAMLVTRHWNRTPARD